MANHFFDTLVARGQDQATFLEAPGRAAQTYVEMRRNVAAMGQALIDLGVAPGDRVAAQIEKTPEGLILYLAAVHAGAVFLPLNTAYTAAELEYFIGDAQPKVLVCDPAKRDTLLPIALRAGVANVETLDDDGHGSIWDRANATADTRAAPVARAPNDLAAILYTSGTTGRSKGAMLTHRNLVSNAEALVDTWRFTAADRLLHALPIYHTHGLFVATNTVLASGAGMI